MKKLLLIAFLLLSCTFILGQSTRYSRKEPILFVASEGYACLPNESIAYGAFNSVGCDATAGKLRVIRFCLKGKYKVSSASFYSNPISDFGGMAIYSSDGNTKIFDTGMGSALGMNTKTGLSSVLTPSCYILAWGSPTVASTTTFAGLTYADTALGGLLNSNSNAQTGTAANTLSGTGGSATFPATLGTITAEALTAWPYLIVKP